jgi:DNA processing protein
MTAPPGVADDVLLARAYLSRVCEPGCVPLWSFVEEVGPLDAVAAIRCASAPDEVRAAAAARRDSIDAQADLAAADRHGIRLVCPESADWPHFALAALYRLGPARVAAHNAGDRRARESGEPIPPIALWVKGSGDLVTVATRSVAIVGARASTAYGDHVSADLGYGLARAGVSVVSGGAYGIDARAHRSALTAEGSAILISAGGLDRPYPAANAALFDAVAASGLLVSESPPGAAPQRHRFLSRNRLIAAFSSGTVVVEAAVRSGAANTAAHACEMGRPVMAVPGPVTSPMSSGCHALLRQPETILVTCVADVLAVVGTVGEGITDAASGGVGVRDVRAELDMLDSVARRVFDGLPAGRAARPDEIALRSGVPVVEVIRALPVLDLAGLLDSSDAGYRIARRLRASRREVPA